MIPFWLIGFPVLFSKVPVDDAVVEVLEDDRREPLLDDGGEPQ